MDRTFQITRAGLIPAGGPFSQTWNVPFASNPEYKDDNAMYLFEMTTVWWSTDTSDCGFAKHAFGIPIAGGTATLVEIPSGVAIEVYKAAGGSGTLTSVSIASVGGNLEFTLNFAVPNSSDRYYRCWINAFSSDNVSGS